MSNSVEVLRKDAAFVPEVRSPTVRRRELGALLRALRLESGFTVEQAADRLLFSMSKLSRMETGHGVATPRDIRDLCELYGVTDEAERDRMLKLALEGKQQGWWQSYDLGFGDYVGLEAAATGLQYFQSSVVPGLLQTADYARAVHEAVVPRLAPDRIDELVEVRMMRQRRLTQEPPLTVSVVIDEAAIHRVVGGAAIMRAQLDRLIKMASMPNVTMQVIPFAAGAHPALDCAFRILEFTDAVPEVVYVEALSGGFFVERPDQISTYNKTFDHLRVIALNPQESIELVTRISASYKEDEISRPQ
jgi:transcriptional regulator with XRE-family HTH domain